MFAPLLLTALLQSQTAQPAIAAVLTKESGSVQLTRGTVIIEGKLRERLVDGDKVKVSTPGTALVAFQSTREVWRLSAGSAVKVDGNRLATISGAPPVLVTKLTAGKSDPKGKRTVGLAGVLRGSARGIEPIGAVRQGPIVIDWVSEAWVASARVEMYTVEGVMVWSFDAPDPSTTRVEVPATAIKPGEWYQVQVLLGGQKGADGLARRERRQTEIKLLSKDEATELKSSEEAISVALKDDVFTLGDTLGELYASYALISEFRKSIAIGYKERAEGPEAFFRLGDLYLLAGFRPEAMAAYTKAWDLGNRDPELKEAIRLLSGGGQ